MPRLFNRIITFNVEGEIYDTDTTAESIIRNYTFTFKNFHDDGYKSFIELNHKDNRGKITNMIRSSKIWKSKVPDSEYFLI